ncbi:MAG: hypothetical protein GWM92_05460 [Gemmatimonadetes bacterium]|nr:hypothetical protein [Gemmatimonadota bacterium]NIR80265.1 hypothetical protein [Gemmatimonadota bacterium]NIT86591.1 hypothetical protein [Gemmatimonadota bacterium]NIU32821.1 hypothetical protein [Gemmatimonadota bacterium]NIU37241.1 hypothetical protein [Gemmatimonadota bacterium]
MLRTPLKFALLIAAALLVSAGIVSMVLYGSVSPCGILAEERARRARDAAEELIGDAGGARSLEEAAERAQEVVDRARGNVERAADDAREVVEELALPECASELWDEWF